MDEQKDQEGYSSEVADTTALDTPAEVTETGEVSRDPRTAEFPNQAPGQFTPWPEPVLKQAPTVSGEFLEFLKRTKYIWLIAALFIFGLLAAVTAVKRMSQRAAVVHEERHQTAAATITPDTLTARCGQPTADVTKDIYPMITRTMSYETADGNIIFSFSRTAEAKSEWVFLSMKDDSGAKSYDTPDEKVAAMSCLNVQN